MRTFLRSNITWLYRYFDKNRGLLKIFSFLMVAQQSVSAFKIVLIEAGAFLISRWLPKAR